MVFQIRLAPHPDFKRPLKDAHLLVFGHVNQQKSKVFKRLLTCFQSAFKQLELTLSTLVLRIGFVYRCMSFRTLFYTCSGQ